MNIKLLIKLKDIGIAGNILKWIECFLTNRKQSVKINHSYSKFKNVLPGVPQGSVIGPLLFIIFINDITNIFSDKIKIDLFADDTKIHLQSNNLSDRKLMQLAINLFLSWSKNWQLDIAPNKTNLMSLNSILVPKYYIENKLINNCISNKDLGIIFDNCLYFDKNVIECCRGALMTINNLFRCFITSDVIMLLKAYITYAPPKLEFATTVWNPGLKAIRYNGLTDKLESVQRLFTRRLFDTCGRKYTNYNERLNYLELKSLELRRIHNDLIMTFKIVNNLCKVDYSEILYFTKKNSRTRGHDLKLQACKSRTNVHMNYLNNRIINVWNNLDYETVHSPSLNYFKSRINKINFNRYLSIMRSITFL